MLTTPPDPCGPAELLLVVVVALADRLERLERLLSVPHAPPLEAPGPLPVVVTDWGPRPITTINGVPALAGPDTLRG
ncbi:MAG: hypothetical protein ACKO8I_19325 [Cyanobacteriota bacterium]